MAQKDKTFEDDQGIQIATSVGQAKTIIIFKHHFQLVISSLEYSIRYPIPLVGGNKMLIPLPAPSNNRPHVVGCLRREDLYRNPL